MVKPIAADVKIKLPIERFAKRKVALSLARIVRGEVESRCPTLFTHMPLARLHAQFDYPVAPERGEAE